MHLSSHTSIVVPAPIIIPSAPILPEQRIVFGRSDSLEQSKPETSPEEPPNKKRKKDRACDYCRRRKIKCDGPWRQTQVCSNCLHGHRRCTYIESSKPRGPPKAYVTALEDKIERLEGIVKQLYPNKDFSEELGPPIVRNSWKSGQHESSNQEPKLSVVQPNNNVSLSILKKPVPTPTASLGKDIDFPMSQIERTTHLIFDSPRHLTRRVDGRKSLSPQSSVSDSSDSANESDGETVESGLGGRHKYGLTAIENDDQQLDSRVRFHGRSSTAGLVEVTRRFKHLCLQERDCQARQSDQGRETGSEDDVTARRKSVVRKPDNNELQAFRRIEFWSTLKWESAWNSHNSHDPELIAEVLKYFPPGPIASELVDLFFLHTNPYLPLLHRPTFERYWRQGLHRDNVWFATLCVLIFAVASRWYDSGGEPLKSWLQNDEQWTAAGWKWFFVALDVHCARRSLSCPATLLEIQTFALMVIFLRGTTCLPTGWLFVSIGLRKAQDRGAHRRAVYRNYPNVDDELWKRAFWVLLAFDHILGASLGRGIATGQEDYDLDLPLEVDDEYWETGNPVTDFKQPDNIPSKLSCFTQFLKLAEIIAFSAKTLYPVDKRRVFLGFVKGDWTGEVVHQLKMAMEEFIHRLPPHLQWNENDPDSIFTRQAATVHSLYHCISMTQSRPFCAYSPLAAPRGDGNRQSAAMSQCAKSIKACGRILAVELRRGLSNAPMMLNACLVCAGTLAMILWVLQKKMVASGRGKTRIKNFEIEKTGIYIYELLDAVEICMKVLDLKKLTWEYAEELTEKLKAALPSDRDGSFETLDIPVPPVQGINNLMRVPGHLDGNSPPFKIPPDAVFSFMSRDPPRPDLQPTAYTAQTAGTTRHTGSMVSQKDSALTHTHHLRMNTPIPIDHIMPDRLFSTPIPNYSMPSKGRRSFQPRNGRRSPSPSRGFIPYPMPRTTGLPGRFPCPSDAEVEPAASRETRSIFIRGSEMYDPGFVSHSLPSNATAHADFQYEIGARGSLQTECQNPVRTRTASLVDKSVPPTEEGRDVPCISSLRRTSFPNLRDSKRDRNYTEPLGMQQSNRSLPNVAMENSYEFSSSPDTLNNHFRTPQIDMDPRANLSRLVMHYAGQPSPPKFR